LPLGPHLKIRQTAGEVEVMDVETTLATETHYDYDDRGNLLQITDANTHVTRFKYDSLGRRIWRRLPGGQVEHWDYDTEWNGTELLNVQIHRDFENYPTLVKRNQ
jgi:YD repeat-containing protein